MDQEDRVRTRAAEHGSSRESKKPLVYRDVDAEWTRRRQHGGWHPRDDDAAPSLPHTAPKGDA